MKEKPTKKSSKLQLEKYFFRPKFKKPTKEKSITLDKISSYNYRSIFRPKIKKTYERKVYYRRKNLKLQLEKYFSRY